MSAKTLETTRPQRREASRRRLFAAAIDSLVEDGYSRTTTAAIARRAGLSNGALFHLYGSKEQLIVAAVVDLIHSLVEAVNADLDGDAPEGPLSVAEFVDRAFELMRSKQAQAILELHHVARTHPDIQNAVREAEGELRATMVEYMAQRFPGLRDSPRLTGIAGLVVSSVTGAALLGLSLGEGYELVETRRELVAAVEVLVAEAEA